MIRRMPTRIPPAKPSALPGRNVSMAKNIKIEIATVDDSPPVAVMVGELLGEIMDATGSHAFNFDLDATTARLKGFIEQGRYHVLLARDAGGSETGFVAMYACQALYAEGCFGTMPELYVRPAYRSPFQPAV